MNSYSKSIKVIMDPFLYYSGIVMYGMGVACLVIAAFSATIWQEDWDSPIGGAVLFGFIGLGMLGACVAASPRWFGTIKLTEKTIQFKTWFKPLTEREYRDYRYIYRATYYHSGFYPKYLVLARRRMTTDELMQINQVAPSEKVIKMRYTKRNQRKLAAILPKDMKTQIDALFPELKKTCTGHTGHRGRFCGKHRGRFYGLDTGDGSVIDKNQSGDDSMS